jgi:hypothetical protein
VQFEESWKPLTNQTPEHYAGLSEQAEQKNPKMLFYRILPQIRHDLVQLEDMFRW